MTQEYIMWRFERQTDTRTHSIHTTEVNISQSCIWSVCVLRNCPNQITELHSVLLQHQPANY